jgi:hypothetical protein
MENHPAARVPLGSRFLQLDPGIAQVVGGDVRWLRLSEQIF